MTCCYSQHCTFVIAHLARLAPARHFPSDFNAAADEVGRCIGRLERPEPHMNNYSPKPAPNYSPKPVSPELAAGTSSRTQSISITGQDVSISSMMCIICCSGFMALLTDALLPIYFVMIFQRYCLPYPDIIAICGTPAAVAGVFCDCSA